MKKVSIALVDGHAMFRKTLVSYLENVGGLSVAFDVDRGKNLFKELKVHYPDIILMAYDLPGRNGIELMQILKARYPTINVIMLSNFDHEVFINQAISNGASGYLSKFGDPEEIFLAINQVIRKGFYLSEMISTYLINHIRSGSHQDYNNKVVNKLSQIELKVIQLLSEELTTKDIAKRLSKSVRTIDSYKSSIMRKTGSSNACGIIMFGIRNGLILIEPYKSMS